MGPVSDAAFRVSVSDIKTYTECPQLWNYKRHVEPPFFREAYAVGTMVHAGLAARLRGEPLPPAPAEVRFATPADLHMLSKLYTHYTPYLEEWTHPFTEVLEVETPHSLDFGSFFEIQILLDGTPDALGLYKGKLWHLQHKTLDMRKNPDKFALTQRYDWHEIVYETMAKEQYPKYEFGGTLLNVCTKYEGGRVKEGTKEYKLIFRQYELQREPARVRQEMTALQHTVSAMLLAVGSLRKNRTACWTPYGGVCPFLSVCNGEQTLEALDFPEVEKRYG